MDVSIIIVNYNTFALTKATIESVFEKTENIAFEIIVVDNNSPDGSGPHLRDFFGKKIKYIQNSENIGFGQANNIGFENSKGRYIFLLNPDTLLLNNAVKILADHLDHHPQVGVCGGNLYNENGLPVLSFNMCFPSVFRELNYLFRDLLYIIRYGKCRYFNHTDTPLKVAYISGADMMLRTSILNIVGGFDPDFFMYLEETELTHRIKKKTGYCVHSVPQAKIIHLVGKSSSNDLTRMKLLLTGRRIYYQKTHGYLGRSLVKIIFTLNVLSKLCLAIAKLNKQKIRYWQTALQYV